MSVAPPPSSPRDRRRRLRLLLVLVGGLLLLGGTAYLLLADRAPAEVDGDDAAARLGSTAEDDSGAEVSDIDEPAGTDGTWTVTTEVEPFDLAAGTGSFVGYRIDEELANVGVTQAVGRTPAVDGELTARGTRITELVVTGDLTEMVSDRPRRDDRVADALRVSTDPQVRFLADAVDLPEALEDGGRIEVEVPGRLEAAGGATDVVAAVTAQRRGEVVVVTGATEVALADLGITPPTAAIVISVADTATLEWQLHLTRG